MAHYPTPAEVGIKTAPHIIQSRFDKGFRHALMGGRITDVKQLRLSYREGFRAGHLYLKELRKAQGLHTFPLQGKIKMSVYM